MCIIVAKKKGLNLPSKQTLKNCFNNNNDGAGFMYNDKNKIIIKKGFNDFEEFYKVVTSIKDLKNKNVVLHFRIGTSGGINKQKTHPFALSNNDNILNSTSLVAKCGIAHNGVLSDYVYKNELSDTQNFIKDFLFTLSKLNDNFIYNEDVQRLIKKEIGTSKLAFLKNDNLITIGDFITEDGILYSNTSYTYDKTSFYNYYFDSYNKYYDRYYTGYNKYKKSKYKEYESLFMGDTIYTKDGTIIDIDRDNMYYLKNSDLYQKINGNYSLVAEDVNVLYGY